MAAPRNEIAGRVELMRGMAERAWDRGEFFFYIRIPEALRPDDRGDKYEEPLAAALRKARLGRICGGGTQAGEGRTIAYCGIDVVLRERVRGLDVLRATLIELGAPQDTVIEEFLPIFCEHPLVPAS
jgi:hypothetical protein